MALLLLGFVSRDQSLELRFIYDPQLWMLQTAPINLCFPRTTRKAGAILQLYTEGERSLEARRIHTGKPDFNLPSSTADAGELGR